MEAAQRLPEVARELADAALSRDATLEKGVECLKALYALAKARGVSPEELHYHAASPKRQRTRREKAVRSAGSEKKTVPAPRKAWNLSLAGAVGATLALLFDVARRYRRIAAHVAGVRSVDASGRVSALVAPLDAIPFGRFDADLMVRLLRALDDDGRAEYARLYDSGAALGLAVAATVACMLFVRRGRRVAPPLALCCLVYLAADAAVGVLARRAIGAFPAAPVPGGAAALHSGSSLTEGAVGVRYELPAFCEFAPHAVCAKWVSALAVVAACGLAPLFRR